MRDVLEGGVHDALSNGAKNALGELLAALHATQGNDAESSIPALVTALERVANEQEGLDAEPVRELISRAADRLSGESSVQPGTDIGELVVQILLDAASGDEAAS